MKLLKLAIIEDSKEFAQLVDWVMEEVPVVRFKEVSHFEDDNFDAVFCDLRLKETWGIDTVTALRPKTNAAIIVLTGLAGATMGITERLPLLDAGADEVFLKDKVNDPHFKDEIKALIKKRREANATTTENTEPSCSS